MRRLVTVFSMIILLATCQDSSNLPFDVGDMPSPSRAILDAVHGDGNEHFFWLPPLVSDPQTDGTFDPSFLPLLTVQVCELGIASECVGAPVAEFTSTSGPGSETIRIDEEAGHYIVNWQTSDSELEGDPTYRIEVLVSGNMVGFADVDVVDRGSGLRSVDTDQFIGLVDGRTLPIKFRIEGDRAVVIDPENITLLSSEEEREAGLYRFQVNAGQIPEIAVGDVLVGSEYGGFLRRVEEVTVQGNLITAQTSQASLADIIGTGSFQTEVDLGIEPGAAPVIQQGDVVWGETRAEFLAEGVSMAPDGLSLSDIDVCEDLLGGLCPPGVSLEIPDGQLHFTPKFDFGGKWEFFSLTEVHAIAKGEMDFDATLRADVGASFNLSGEKTWAILSKPFFTWIGPFPFAGEVRLNLVVGMGVEGSAGVQLQSAGFQSLHTVEIGTRYENKDWSAIHEFAGDFGAVPSSWNAQASIAARAFVRPDINVHMYGALGPFANLEPYLGAKGVVSPTECGFEVKAGIDANVGFRVGIFDDDLTDYAATFEGPAKELYKELCSEQVHSISFLGDDPISMEVGETIGLQVKAVDLQGDEILDPDLPIEYETSDPSVVTFAVTGPRTVDVTAHSSGTATVTVTSQGKSDFKTISVVDDLPPPGFAIPTFAIRPLGRATEYYPVGYCISEVTISVQGGRIYERREHYQEGHNLGMDTYYQDVTGAWVWGLTAGMGHLIPWSGLDPETGMRYLEPGTHTSRFIAQLMGRTGNEKVRASGYLTWYTLLGNGSLERHRYYYHSAPKTCPLIDLGYHSWDLDFWYYPDIAG